MTEIKKVKITQEQANAIECLKESEPEYWTDEKIIAIHSLSPKGWTGNSENLKNMPLLLLVDALRIGYDIKPTFKVGDWIVRLDGGDFLVGRNMVQVLEVTEQGKLRYNMLYQIDCRLARLATEDEVNEMKFWSGMNREVKEFRIGDAFVSSSGYMYRIVSDDSIETADAMKISQAIKMYDGGYFKGLYPVGTFKPLNK